VISADADVDGNGDASADAVVVGAAVVAAAVVGTGLHSKGCIVSPRGIRTSSKSISKSCRAPDSPRQVTEHLERLWISSVW